MIEYTIFQVDDSRQSNVDRMRSLMVGWDEFPNVAVNGLVFKDYSVKSWPGATLGQVGVWHSFLNALSLAPMLTLDDDAILSENFSYQASWYIAQLPTDADFFSLYAPPQFASMYRPSKHGGGAIVRAYQPNGGVAMFYTKRGQGRIQYLINRDGFQMQYDNQLYNYSWHDELNGYTLRPDIKLVEHDDMRGSIVQSGELYEV